MKIFLLLVGAGVMKYVLLPFLEGDASTWIKIAEIVLVMIIGAGYVLKGAAEVIEETTEVLSERTKIASGVLQSLGTAFPDMAIGVVAAVLSLKVASSDYGAAINYAIIAGATTFGSNIYNIGHAAWCIFRQNKANKLEKTVLMFPFMKRGGKVTPMKLHRVKPVLGEFETANDVLNALTLMTATVAISMVIFGKISNPPANISGDLYQLIRPVGVVIFLVAAGLMYAFRKAKRPVDGEKEVVKEEKFFRRQSLMVIWVALIAAGLAILMAAETMVGAISVLTEITGIPTVIAGVLSGIIGCLGEMIVVHNFTINPEGRIGDAIVGVAMDNIVTTMGAAIVAIMGGIFLGGNALILIFVLILALNTTLMWQISKLKNFYLKEK